MYFPDVIQEGNAINSVLNVKHVIVGAETEYACDIMRELLRPFSVLVINIFYANTRRGVYQAEHFGHVGNAR